MEGGKKIEYIFHAITDTQELIRFIDTKTGFVITIIGAYLILVFSLLENIIKCCSKFSVLFWILLSIFFILIIISVLITKRIIKPTNNPIKNINLEEKALPKLKYYIGENNYQKMYFKNIKNSDKFKLNTSFHEYAEIFKNIEEVDVIESLMFELLKISYIRNIKSDRFNSLLNLVIYTTIFLICFLFLFIIEK